MSHRQCAGLPSSRLALPPSSSRQYNNRERRSRCHSQNLTTKELQVYQLASIKEPLDLKASSLLQTRHNSIRYQTLAQVLQHQSSLPPSRSSDCLERYRSSRTHDKMVRFSTVALAVACSLSPLAAAKACAEGIDYCGWNLLRRGSYPAFSPLSLVVSSNQG